MAGSEGKQIRSPAASGLHQTHPAEAPAALQGRGGQVGQRGCVPSQALPSGRQPRRSLLFCSGDGGDGANAGQGPAAKCCPGAGGLLRGGPVAPAGT